MGLHLYAISRASLADLDLWLEGLGGAEVSFVRAGRLCAAVSPLAEAPAPELAALETHRRVQEILFAWETILPIRFGTMLADAEAVRSFLAAKEAVFCKTLRRLDGKVEVTLQIGWGRREPKQPPREHSPGRQFLAGRLAYLADLRAYKDEARNQAGLIHDYLLGQALAGLAHYGRAGLLLAGDYLVARDGVERFIARCQSARDLWPDFTFRATGPWPPAAFAEAWTKD